MLNKVIKVQPLFKALVIMQPPGHIIRISRMMGIDPLEIEVAVISGADDSHHFFIGLKPAGYEPEKIYI